MFAGHTSGSRGPGISANDKRSELEGVASSGCPGMRRSSRTARRLWKKLTMAGTGDASGGGGCEMEGEVGEEASGRLHGYIRRRGQLLHSR